MILEIKKYPDPILRKKCAKVETINQDVQELAKEMLKIMHQNRGIGLAASQVGFNKKIIVIDMGKGPLVLINPEIIEKSTEFEIDEEGCLSLPGIFVNVKRPKEIVVSGLDENGKPIKMKVKNLLARVIQHEIDHLSGILIIDKKNFLKKFLFSLKSIFRT